MKTRDFAWPHAAPPAARRRSPFWPWVDGTLIALTLLVTIGVNLWLITDRHAAYQSQQRMCAEEVRQEIRRRPMLKHMVRLADDCATLRRMRGQG